MALVNFTAPSAADVTQNYNPHPEAAALLQPGQTPTQYSQALQQGNYSQDQIQFLAHGMPPQQSVGWACQSSSMVQDKMAPADQSALQAAQAWVKSPTPANQSAAAAAAAQTNFQGPGAWAAQGAAWAPTPGAPAAAAAPGLTGHAVAPGLTGHAVAGSVMLAAALKAPQAPQAPQAPALQMPTAPTVPTLQAPQLTMPQAPTAPTLTQPPPATLAERQQIAPIHQPFIDLGNSIASGQKPYI